jgi:hypothetical protein
MGSLCLVLCFFGEGSLSLVFVLLKSERRNTRLIINISLLLSYSSLKVPKVPKVVKHSFRTLASTSVNDDQTNNALKNLTKFVRALHQKDSFDRKTTRSLTQIIQFCNYYVRKSATQEQCTELQVALSSLLPSLDMSFKSLKTAVRSLFTVAISVAFTNKQVVGARSLLSLPSLNQEDKTWYTQLIKRNEAKDSSTAGKLLHVLNAGSSTGATTATTATAATAVTVSTAASTALSTALTAAARQCQIDEQIAARRKQNSAFRFNRLMQTITVDGVTDVYRNTIEQAVFDPKRTRAQQMNSAMLMNHSLRFDQLEELLEERFADLIATNNAAAMASTSAAMASTSGKTRRILVGNVFSFSFRI